MTESTTESSFDHSSDPKFFAYYAALSESASTLQRFGTVRDKALKLIRQRRDLHDVQLDVLDVGCNAGTQVRMWASLGHRVTGLDVNAPLLELARDRAVKDGLSVRFDVGTATALPYADSAFDVCLLPELLEHVQDWQSCLNEAVRVLRPGGLLYLSTTNALCPKQQEFNLPFYSWYPAFLKRHFEKLAVTSRPELANHARYPAVHWFTFGQLRRYLGARKIDCLDRFDVIETKGRSLSVRAAVWALQNLAPLRLLGHLATPGTMVIGFKRL